jgi:hypothetical protein
MAPRSSGIGGAFGCSALIQAVVCDRLSCIVLYMTRHLQLVPRLPAEYLGESSNHERRKVGHAGSTPAEARSCCAVMAMAVPGQDGRMPACRRFRHALLYLRGRTNMQRRPQPTLFRSARTSGVHRRSGEVRSTTVPNAGSLVVLQRKQRAH